MDLNKDEIIAEENDEELKELKELAINENIAFLALIASNSPINVTPSREEYAQIGIKEEYELVKAIRAIKKNSNTEKLFLLINSPGGTVESSYIIAHALQESFKDIIVFIPHIAASGATLISLVGKLVIMDGLISRISPLDPQINYKEEFCSVNTVIRSFQAIEDYFSDKHEDDTPYPWKVLAENHDPVFLQECFDTIDLMSKYAFFILSHKSNHYVRYDKEVPNELDLETVKSLVEKFLSLEYPLHEYAILADEAKEIGLKIFDVSKKEEINVFQNEFNNKVDFGNIWAQMVNWFEKYKDVPSSYHFIRYIIPKNLGDSRC